MARNRIPTRIAQAVRDMLGLMLVVTVRATVDPASVAAEGTGETTVATATGALLGDYVVWGCETKILNVNAGIHVYVSAADTISIQVSNNVVAAGAALDLASAAWRFTVLRGTGA